MYIFIFIIVFYNNNYTYFVYILKLLKVWNLNTILKDIIVHYLNYILKLKNI